MKEIKYNNVDYILEIKISSITNARKYAVHSGWNHGRIFWGGSEKSKLQPPVIICIPLEMCKKYLMQK